MGRGSWHSWPQVGGGLRRIQSLWQGTPAAVSQDPRLLSPGDHFGPPLCLTVPTSGQPGSIQEAPAPCFPCPLPVPWSPSSASSLWMALECQMPCGEFIARESLSQREQLLPGTAAPPALCPAQAYPSSLRSACPALGDPAQKRAGLWDSWIDPTAQPVLSNQKNAARHPVHSS